MSLLHGLLPLTLANIKSFYRDRASLFWTIAFPVLFVILFGSIFGSNSTTTFNVGWVDQDGTPAATQLRAGFASVSLLDIKDETQDQALAEMKDGKLDAVIVVPQGLGAALTPGASAPASGPFQLVVYTDPSRQTASSTVQQVVAAGRRRHQPAAQRQAAGAGHDHPAAADRSTSQTRPTSCPASWPWRSCSWASSPRSRSSASARS